MSRKKGGRKEKGVLTHSKGRLLAYLVWFGKIKCKPSVRGDVMRWSIGYKSPGHWSGDLSDLIDEGYIVLDKRDGYYRPTEKAKKLLEPILNLKRAAVLNIVASVVILLVGFMVYVLSGFILFFAWNLLVSLYLCIINYHALHPFHLLFKKFPK